MYRPLKDTFYFIRSFSFFLIFFSCGVASYHFFFPFVHPLGGGVRLEVAMLFIIALTLTLALKQTH